MTVEERLDYLRRAYTVRAGASWCAWCQAIGHPVEEPHRPDCVAENVRTALAVVDRFEAARKEAPELKALALDLRLHGGDRWAVRLEAVIKLLEGV